MASEPELRSGSSGEWVLYLQQSINHHYQQPVIAEDGDFDAALEAVVRHFQRQQDLAPTGSVDGDTWLALTGGASAVPEQRPSVRYTWPDVPVAAATVDVGDTVVELALTLTGDTVVTFPPGADPAEAAPAAGAALDGFAGGLSVADLESSPALSAVGTEFAPPAADFVDAGRVEFAGACELAYTTPTALGDAEVTGSLGYRLAVAVAAAAPEIDSTDSWLTHHGRALAAVGVVVLAAAFAIETGAAGLVGLGG